MTVEVMDTPEPLMSVVARQVRGRMGEVRISGNRLAPLMGMSQAAFSRRSIGEHAFSLGEIEQLADLLNVNVGYLLGLEERRSPRPISDEGLRAELLVRHQGLEPRTRWFAASDAHDELAIVLAFHRPVDRAADAAAGARTPDPHIQGSSSCENVRQLFPAQLIGDAS